MYCIFFTCPLDIGYKYMLDLIEILLVPGTRTSDFFTPGITYLFEIALYENIATSHTWKDLHQNIIFLDEN